MKNIIFVFFIVVSSSLAQDLKFNQPEDESKEVPALSVATTSAKTLLGGIVAIYGDLDDKNREKINLVMYNVLFGYFIKTKYFKGNVDLDMEKQFVEAIPILLGSEEFNLMISYPPAFFTEENVFNGGQLGFKMSNGKLKTKNFPSIESFEEMNKDFRSFLEKFN
jgi:hypothetical protein